MTSVPLQRPTRQVGPYTWDDFIATDDEDKRELVDGHLLELEMPTEAHEYAVAELIRLLGNWAKEHGGRVLGSGYKVRISSKRGVMPDLQYYRKGRKRPPPQGLDDGSPDLVVELVSPSSASHDRVSKFNWYREIGVPEYWVIDVIAEQPTMLRHVLYNGHYMTTAFSTDDTFAPETFPGLSFSLVELLSPDDG